MQLCRHTHAKTGRHACAPTTRQRYADARNAVSVCTNLRKAPCEIMPPSSGCIMATTSRIASILTASPHVLAAWCSAASMSTTLHSVLVRRARWHVPPRAGCGVCAPASRHTLSGYAHTNAAKPCVCPAESSKRCRHACNTRSVNSRAPSPGGIPVHWFLPRPARTRSLCCRPRKLAAPHAALPHAHTARWHCTHCQHSAGSLCAGAASGAALPQVPRAVFVHSAIPCAGSVSVSAPSHARQRSAGCSSMAALVACRSSRRLVRSTRF